VAVTGESAVPEPSDTDESLAAQTPVRERGPIDSGSTSIRAVLRNRAFLRLWLAQAISQTANNMVNFALLLRVRGIVEVHDLPQANTAISLVIIAFSLPAVLFGPIAGVLADRVNRRTLMAVIQLVRVVAVLCFVVIRPGWPAETALIAHYVGTFIFGIAGQFFAPAQGATIPTLVPRHQLMSANALFNLTFTASQLIGFATLGPALAKIIGVDQIFVLTAILFLVCAGLVMSIPNTSVPSPVPSDVAAHPVRRLLADLLEGLIYIRRDPVLIKAIAYLSLAAATFLTIAALGPDFVTGVIGLEKEDIGYIVGPAGAGVLVGVVLVRSVSRRVNRSTLIDGSMALAGLMLLLIALAPDALDALWKGPSAPLELTIAVEATLAAVLGICNAFILVPSQTMLQEHSQEHVRARVYAAFFTISNTISFLPTLFAAALADVYGSIRVLVGVALVLGGLGSVNILRGRMAEEARWRRLRTRHRQGPETLVDDTKD
jgi:MFS family permease